MRLDKEVLGVVVDAEVGGRFRELSLIFRPRRHCYLAWFGFSTFRTVYNVRCAYIMWRGRTKWIKEA